MKKPHRILVMDGSRVVRASLAKHLGGEYEVIEESNGDSAWQVLMLDHKISLVISGLHTSKLEAVDLQTRLRSSSIRRLREMPLVLIVSDQHNQATREHELPRGANGFITKTMKRQEILQCLKSLLSPEIVPAVPAAEETKPAFVATPAEPDRLLSREQLSSSLSGLPQGEPISALVFGIDGRTGLIARFGQGAAARIEERFASLLVAKINPMDLAGKCQGERLAVISRGVDLHQAAKFGKKVCKSLASGQIVLRGEKVRLTASVGVASTSDDVSVDAQELLAIANQRLDQALICGGNTVATEFHPACPGHCRTEQVSKVVEALRAPENIDDPSEIAGLARQLLPLLKVMDRHLALKLPLEHIERQLLQADKTVADPV
jgi:diguanylate cyclase (GGDEF)-like protein